jgi:hypothetical protein
MIRFATLEQLKDASDILRAEYPKPRISHTTDSYVGLSAIQREVLFMSDRMPIRLLEVKNKR